ncbi:PucR family transcriptional regulator [Weissella confusa]|uniref:PucR family transcriptional regulator n=1 Tax=Weissella confusa TaxID=1583 RepID=UPI0022DEB052|nr:helix-turn-helix domain-containing protein [Weissella confusa]
MLQIFMQNWLALPENDIIADKSFMNKARAYGVDFNAKYAAVVVEGDKQQLPDERLAFELDYLRRVYVLQANEIEQFLPRLPKRALAGVGMPHRDVQESVKEGIFALAMTHPMVDEMRTMYYENMMDLAIIIDAGVAYPETEQLIHDHLDDEVMLTLWLYATFGQSMCALSDELHVHRRTIQYRLDKITTVTGLNPRVTSEACTLLLAYVRRRTSVIVPALVEQLERVMMQADRRQIVNS